MPLLAQTLRDKATNLFVVFNQKESHGMGGTTVASRSSSPRNNELRRRGLYPTHVHLAIAHSHEVSVTRLDHGRPPRWPIHRFFESNATIFPFGRATIPAVLERAPWGVSNTTAVARTSAASRKQHAEQHEMGD
jgi:hypothetical protein